MSETAGVIDPSAKPSFMYIYEDGLVVNDFYKESKNRYEVGIVYESWRIEADRLVMTWSDTPGIATPEPTTYMLADGRLSDPQDGTDAWERVADVPKEGVDDWIQGTWVLKDGSTVDFVKGFFILTEAATERMYPGHYTIEREFITATNGPAVPEFMKFKFFDKDTLLGWDLADKDYTVYWSHKQ